MFQDVFFWAFVATALILGWVWGRVRHLITPLYESIAQLQLERDAQARTIQGQRRVITELEHKTQMQEINNVIKEISEQ
jgi:hypothetical protein